MKKLITIILFSAILSCGLGCGDDDEGNGPTGPAPLTRLEIHTDLSAPPMTSVDDAIWSSVTPMALALSNVNTPRVVTPKPLFFSDSVWVQAIAASDKLYVRLEWDDNDFSIKRDQWSLVNVSSFSFSHCTLVCEEDQVFVMFEMADGTWDTWNWRALTTGQSKAAEGWTFADSVLTVDADNGVHTLAWENYNGFDNSRPIWVHKDKYDFVGDIMFIKDTLSATAAYDSRWYNQMTVPGWIISDTVLPAAMTSQSRWDIAALYDYNETTQRYKLVMSRALTSGTDDLDMADLTEMKVRIGILDDKPISTQGSSNIFTEDFMMDF